MTDQTNPPREPLIPADVPRQAQLLVPEADSFFWITCALLAALIICMGVNVSIWSDLDRARHDLAECRIDGEL